MRTPGYHHHGLEPVPEEEAIAFLLSHSFRGHRRVVIIFIALETTISELLTDMVWLNTRTGDIVIGVVAALAFLPLSKRIDPRMRGWTSVVN